MNDDTVLNRLLIYERHYATCLEKQLRHRSQDRKLTYCLGMWLDGTSAARLQEIFKQKRTAIVFVTHTLALLLLAISLAFYFAFAWYFFP